MGTIPMICKPTPSPNSAPARLTETLPRRSCHGAGRLAVLCRWARPAREGVMIHHLSIAARDPRQAAQVLAELMGGTAVPFPPNPGSFFALQLDEHGSGVEVYPAGTHLEPNGDTGGSFKK